MGYSLTKSLKFILSHLMIYSAMMPLTKKNDYLIMMIFFFSVLVSGSWNNLNMLDTNSISMVNDLSLVMYIGCAYTLMLTHKMKPSIHLVSMVNMLVFVFFFTFSVLVFVISFEMSLGPMVVAIMAFGYQPERVVSMIVMLLFSTLLSVPFIIYLCVSNSCMLTPWVGGLNFFSMKENSVNIIMIMLMFATKIPVFFLHMWLPLAHSEAPVWGSMMLASIYLKLGVWGVMTLNSCPSFSSMNFLSKMVMMGTVIMSLMVTAIMDSKIIIAYSSIIHLMMAFISMVFFKYIEVKKTVLFMSLGHSFNSTCLFLINFLFYSGMNSRMLGNMKISFKTPGSTLLIVSTVMNISFPLTLVFWGEINFIFLMKLMNMVSEMVVCMIIMIMNMVFSLLYMTSMLMNSKLSYYKPAHSKLCLGVNWITTSLFSLVMCFVFVFLV